MIRNAILQDANALLELELKCFDKENFALSKRAFKYNIKKNNLFIYEVDKKIVGYILLFLRKNSPKARIYSLATDEDFRGRGIAAKLVDETVKTAKKEGRKIIKLEVRQDNIKAIKLYEKLGFAKIKTLQKYYLDDSDAFLMEIDIS